MNHFIALAPDADTRDRLAAVADRLRAWDLPARWVHPDDYHLTVAFLGPLEAAELQGGLWAVNDVARSLFTPQLDLPGIGAFGGKHEPRVVYAAVGDPAGYCRDLHGDLQDCFGERPQPHYLPHITLCRPSGGRSGAEWRPLFEAFGQALWGSCAVDGLVLYRREPHGPCCYQEVETWTLDERLAG